MSLIDVHAQLGQPRQTWREAHCACVFLVTCSNDLVSETKREGNAHMDKYGVCVLDTPYVQCISR